MKKIWTLIYISENSVIPVGTSSIVSLGKDLQIVNLLYGFNPNLKIKSNKNEYIFFYSTYILDKKIDIQENINKETGFVTQILKYTDEETYDVFTYEINVNTTTDENVKMPNINEYTKVIK